MGRIAKRNIRGDRLKTKVYKPGYWDYFSFNPAVPGNELIMRVYEGLYNMQVPFYFSYYFGDALFTYGLKEHLRVHFYLPNQNMAIIVKGNYWFERGNNINETALDAALLEYAGIKAVLITEEEVMLRGVAEILRSIPELQVPFERGMPLETDYPPYDYRAAALRPPHPPRAERTVSVKKVRRAKGGRASI